MSTDVTETSGDAALTLGAAPDITNLALTPPTPARLRRWRRPALVVLLVLASAVVAAALTSSSQGSDALDPDSAAPQGARALRVLLQDQGVAVTRVTTSTAAVHLADQQTSLVVVSAGRLGSDALARLTDYPGALVLVEPTPRVLAVLAPGLVPVDEGVRRVREPMCDYPIATRAGSADAGGLAISGSAPPGGSLDLCYPVGSGASVVHIGYADGRSVVVIGSGDGMSNDLLGNEGNASLSLGLLGTSSRLTWLMAGIEPGTGGQKSLTQLLPKGFELAALELAILVVVVAVWRGRRLGPLVVERLPTVVRAAETTEGRARMYRKAHAVDRAAGTLRAASLRRLLPLVGLGPRASAAEAIPLIAAKAGRSADETRALLFGPAPADDAALVRLKDQLDALERTVRRS